MRNQLMTKEVERKLPPLYANEGKPSSEIPVVAKFFTPDAQCTWFITEGNKLEDGDFEFFGLCDLGFGTPELGYVQLCEIAAARGALGLKAERDLYYRGTLADAMKATGYPEAA